MTKRWWIAILGRDEVAAAVRAELHEIPIPEVADLALPEPGDRVAILALPDARFIGIATAARLRPTGRDVLHVRERVRAPEGHAVDPFALRPHPRCVAGWTRERLSRIAGTFTTITHEDGVRIEAAILAQALAFGPLARRPAHARPRTPGRRALMEGRAASGTLRTRRG